MSALGKIFRRSADKFDERLQLAIYRELGISLDQAKDIIVTEETALSLSSVWSCVRLISDTISVLPIHFYEKNEAGRIRIDEAPERRLLYKPNDYQNKSQLLSALILSVTLWGNGYLRIYRDRRYLPIRLKLLKPSDVRPVESLAGDRWYYSYKGEMLGCDDVIHVRGLSTDGMIGKSPIAVHRENMQLSIAAQRYGKNFFTNGAVPSLIFKKDGVLKDNEAYNRLKADLKARTVGIDNAHSPLLLEGGMSVEKITIPPEDAQFIATRKFQATEIARIFNVPPHMIADLDRATNNNIEQQAIEFVTYCLQPYVIKIEEEFNRKLLREDEFSKRYFNFSFNGLLRGDAKTRSEYYKNMNLIGALNANEVRAYEDMNGYDGGDTYLVQSNMQTIDRAISGDGSVPVSPTDPDEQNNKTNG